MNPHHFIRNHALPQTLKTPESTAPIARFLRVQGQVQGVGYRPFVYRLARRLGIRGWVKNVTGAVEIHAEGSSTQLDALAHELVAAAPAIARPLTPHVSDTPCQDLVDFVILPSESGAPDIHVPPDYFTCPDCLAELWDPGNRRHGYPFINCTQCGPRYTLITALPYDRPNTAMAGFPLCPACRHEYEDPGHRRFHAEPIACPVCGPHLQFVSGESQINGDAAALSAALQALKAGQIVAVKGIGGYHLMCAARHAAAIATLRQRKPRPGKPLALLFPDLGTLRAALHTTPETEALLQSPARPIVLLPRRADCLLPEVIAPGLGEIGAFLPYSPLHSLLLDSFGGPLVATSGNLSGEPVLTDNAEAASRLAHVADAWLHHNRPIVRPADDSVFRPIAGVPRPLRLGRGTAPLELELPGRLAEPVLALGAHTKNTLCLAWDDRAVLSPHIGDLDSLRSLDTLARVAEDLQQLYQVRATRLLLDPHPRYGYHAFARQSGLPTQAIWHHHAHASALAGEFPEVNDWIVFAWDGVGLGEDGTLWGGEALVGRPGQWARRASLRPFRLPGGEQAGRQPWRSAAGLCWESERGAKSEAPCATHLIGLAPPLLRQAWDKGLNCPETSAVGRLFDAAAALTGLCTDASFEGEGPMRLEAAAQTTFHDIAGLTPSPPGGGPGRGNGVGLPAAALINATAFPSPPAPPPGGAGGIGLALSRDASGLWRSDWAPLLAMLQDETLTPAVRAAQFHASLANALVDQARQLHAETGYRHVGLTGGVFQNRLLTELALTGLQAADFVVHLPARVPVNDAGVSFGQIIEHLHAQAPNRP